MTATPAMRHTSLDAIRGIAVMGILLMNIVSFAMPEQAYINPLAWGGARPADLGAWAVSFVLVDGKMRGLFSLLFGASALLVIQAAMARGEDSASIHMRRMGWLLLFGLAHAYLIWAGDILVTYAFIGLFLFLFTERSPRTLMRYGAGFIVLGFLFWAGLAGLFLWIQHAALLPGASMNAIQSYQSLLDSMGQPGTPAIAQEIRIYSGGYAGILHHRMVTHLITPLSMIMLFGLETLGFMLIGMALFKNGFLTGAWPPDRYRRTAILGYLIGIPPMIALCLWCFASGFQTLTVFTATMVWAMPFRIALIVAHAALALWAIRRWEGSAIVLRIAAVGRTAFTNYLGTSIAMTTLFYGYGAGLFGTIPRFGIYAIVLAAWAVMLLWSRPWLDRFAYGPFEWLWRSLARGKLQSLRNR